MICFYHRVDLDGKCSAAIVKHFHPECELYGIDRGDMFPWSKVQNQDVVMVDYCLQPFSDMLWLKEEAKSLTWIDHHISAINYSREYEATDILGFRDTNYAACELTWMYYSNDTTPRAVKLLGRYDVWDHEDIDVIPFQYGVRAMPNRPDSSLWDNLLDDGILEPYILAGTAIENYLTTEYQEYAEDCAFETEFQGLRAIVINRLHTGSKIFESVYDPNRHDIMVSFGWRGKAWRLSLRSDKPEVDVSQIAQKFGGGGHKNAAGCFCTELPFELKE